jgi:WD40 repeat protein
MVVALAFSHDGRLVLSAARDDTIRVWELATGREVSVTAVPALAADLRDRHVSTAAFSPGGDRLLLASDQRLVVRNTESGEILADINAHAPAAWSPDGQTILAAVGPPTRSRMCLVDASSGEVVRALDQEGAFVAAACSPDGARVLTSAIERDRAKQLVLWEARSGQRLVTLAGHVVGSWSCGFSLDAHRVVTAEANDRGELHVWNAHTAEKVSSAMNGVLAVITCTLSPDGATAAGIRGDGSMTVWDASTGKVIASIRQETAELWGLGPLASCAFSPDGRFLVSPSAEGTVRIWEMDELRAIGPASSIARGDVRHVELDQRQRRALVWSHYERPGGWFTPVEDRVAVWDLDAGAMVGLVDSAETNPMGGEYLLGCGFTGGGTEVFTVRHEVAKARNVVLRFSASTFQPLRVDVDSPPPPRDEPPAPSGMNATLAGQFVEITDARGRRIATFVRRAAGGAIVSRGDGRALTGDSVGQIYLLRVEFPPAR